MKPPLFNQQLLSLALAAQRSPLSPGSSQGVMICLAMRESHREMSVISLVNNFKLCRLLAKATWPLFMWIGVFYSSSNSMKTWHFFKCVQ